MNKLEERIKKYNIPAPLYEPVFDRVLVFQIPTMESETFRDGVIFKPNETKKRESAQSPRGVVVSAGMRARDILESHGIQLGDIVWFARHTMWRHELDASSKSFSVIRAGEVCGSEDLFDRIGTEVQMTKDEDGHYQLEGIKRQDPSEYDDQ